MIAPIIVISSFQLAELIITESSLSFLGLGVQPPTPSWGGMLSQGREYLTSAWWLGVFPGLMIILTVLGINLFGGRATGRNGPEAEGVRILDFRFCIKRDGTGRSERVSTARQGTQIWRGGHAA